MTHFQKRWALRGDGRTDAAVLEADLSAALADEAAHSDFIDRMFTDRRTGAGVYRFATPYGRHFMIANSFSGGAQKPVTVCTREMVQRLRALRKKPSKKKKMKGAEA